MKTTAAILFALTLLMAGCGALGESKPKPCTNCKGTMTVYCSCATDQKPCNFCNGTKKQKCGTCRGTGVAPKKKIDWDD